MHWTAADKYFSAILTTKNIWLQGCYLIFLPAILFRIRMEEQDVSAVSQIAGKCQKIVVKYLKVHSAVITIELKMRTGK